NVAALYRMGCRGHNLKPPPPPERSSDCSARRGKALSGTSCRFRSPRESPFCRCRAAPAPAQGAIVQDRSLPGSDPLRTDPPSPVPGAIEAAGLPTGPSRQVKVRPLAKLGPYVMRYRGRATAALVALLVAALATLAVPIA